MARLFRFTCLVCGVVSALCATTPALQASAPKPIQLVKKTMDGRCLEKQHPDFWKTKIYVAKPTVAACIASGGRKV